MKRLILISASMIIAAVSQAQSDCTAGSDNALFKFDNAGQARDVRTLGANPEFPFLRNMSSSRQFYSAIKRADDRNTEGMDHLNGMLMGVGFANGAKDLNESNISMVYLPAGTEGNMGGGGYGTGYYRLAGDAPFKAWKISSNGTCAMYIMAKCGNAFYPKAANRTACVTVPVNLQTQEVTLNSDGQLVSSTDNVYIYYARRKHHKRTTEHPIAEISAKYPSRPLLLRTTNDKEAIPQSYKVTLNSPTGDVTVCPDSTLNLTATINVEKTSEYSGNYPDKNKKEYREVSKKTYRRVARKMRKVERKEHKVDRSTGITVNV